MRYLFTQEKSFKKVVIPIDNSRCVRYLVLNETGELPRFRGLRLTRAGLGSLTIPACIAGKQAQHFCLSLMIAKALADT
jgi:hypothetical protein